MNFLYVWEDPEHPFPEGFTKVFKTMSIGIFVLCIHECINTQQIK